MKPIEIVIEAVQYTPDREPVLIQYAGKGATAGPFARAQQLHATQAALRARSVVSDYWSDVEVKAELVAHLAAHGVEAVLVENVEPPQPPQPPQAPQASQASPPPLAAAAPGASPDPAP